MATYLQDLKTRRDAVAAELAAMSATQPGGKVDMNGEAGGEEHQAYKMNLYKELAELNKMIIDAGGADDAGLQQSTEVITQGFSA